MTLPRPAATARAIIFVLTLAGTAPAAAAPATRPAAPAAAAHEIRLSAPLAPGGGERLTITLDVTEAPDLADWSIDAAQYAMKWYPAVEKLLVADGDGFRPSRDLTFVFRHPMDGVAHRRGDTIVIAAKWVRDNPDDFGMVVHELVHVIQDYPGGNPHWLVEGIADYVRYYVVEPGSRRAAFDAHDRRYTAGYQPAAGFLNWLESTAGPGVIARLNRTMRAGTYSPAAFRAIAGGEPDALWEQFKATLPGTPRAATTRPSTQQARQP